MSTSTRDQLIQAAIRQFADRGFYGTSIASIAAELGLTKQALLHHFGSKEKLYAEIMAIISRRAQHAIEQTRHIEDPGQRLEELIVLRFTEQMEQNDQARLLMREILDNAPRAEQAGNWYLHPYLEELIGLAMAVPGMQTASRAQALALIYQLLGAANYFALSQPTLRNMFGADLFDQTQATFTQVLRATVQRCLQASSA